ncbi:MAG: phage portal protein, partial [Pseudomonadota bacterium]
MSSEDLWGKIYGGNLSKAGASVTLEKAIQVSAVYACARVISEGIAQVPFKLMQHSPDNRKREPAREHNLYRLLASKPNDYQTSFEFREMMGLHLALCKDFFVFKNVVLGKIVELIPFKPNDVKVIVNDDRTVAYKVTAKNGTSELFPAEAIWHVKGPSLDGFEGIEAIKIAREAIGLALATEESQANLHKNGLKTSGLYSVEGTLKDDQFEALKKWVMKEYGGVENTGMTMILDRNAKFQPFTLSSIDAQHLETRRYQVEEICRFFRVMPIMVGYSDKAATYASAEQMFLAHVVHTLAPWYTRIEQSADAHLLKEKEIEQGYYFNFVEEGLLRGSLKDTKDYLLGMVNGGLMTPNEGRSKLDMNPDPDPASDKLRVPANIVGDPVPQ